MCASKILSGTKEAKAVPSKRKFSEKNQEIPSNHCHLKLWSHPSTKVVAFCNDEFVPNLTNELTGIFLGAGQKQFKTYILLNYALHN